MISKIVGPDRVKRKFAQISADMERAIREGVFATAQKVRGEAIKSIATVSIGEMVRRQTSAGGGYNHIASKAGDAPNTDTGALARSIALEPKDPAKSIGVGSALKYAKWLEFGTISEDGKKLMDARPYLEPALEAKKSGLTKEIKKSIKRQLAESKK